MPLQESDLEWGHFLQPDPLNIAILSIWVIWLLVFNSIKPKYAALFSLITSGGLWCVLFYGFYIKYPLHLIVVGVILLLSIWEYLDIDPFNDEETKGI